MQTDTWIGESLRGAHPPWPRPAEVETLLQSAAEHGCTALLHAAVSRRHDLPTAPAALRDALADHARLAAAGELAQRAELPALLDAVAATDLSCLLIKGTPLAYTLYPQAYLRERCDTDLWFADHDRASRALSLFRARGYQVHQPPGGDSIHSQASAFRGLDSGVVANLDVHWRLSNQAVVSTALPFDDVLERAVAVPALHPRARMPAWPDALIIACLHRAAHHAEGKHNRLLWLYDVHLLVTAMDEVQRDEVLARCRQRGLAAVVADGIRSAGEVFATPNLSGWLAPLDAEHGPQTVTMAQFATGWRREWTQWHALGSTAERVAHLRAHLFPAPDYVLAKYGRRHRAWLPWLYARRIGEGFVKRLRRRG